MYPITRYLNIQSAYAPDFTASGQHIVFISNITGVPELWQTQLMPGVELPLWPEQLTFEGNRVMSARCSRAPGDRRLIIARDVGGSENAQLFLLNGAQKTYLTEGHEDAMHLPGEWSLAGDRFLFAANRRDPSLFDLYVQPLEGSGEKARLVWENDAPGYLFGACFAPDGTRAAVSRVASSFRHDLFEINLETGEARQISPIDKSARYLDLHYTPDGDSLYLITDRDSDYLYIARLDLDSLAMETVFAPDADVEALALAPDGSSVVYTVNVHGASTLYRFDFTSGLTHTAPPLDTAPGIVSMMDRRLVFAPDGQRLLFSFTSATRTSDIFVWDLESDTVRAVTRSSHGGLPRDRFRAPEVIHFPTFDEDEIGEARKIPAWFYQPAGDDTEPKPAIVYVHGGPEAQFRPYFHFFIQYFLQNGYAVLAPNVRGSTGYGKTYSHLDDVRKRMDSVADLAHAVYWLREQPDIDGERIVVYGGSYGGFMVLSGMTTFPDLWAAGVNIVGVSNLATFLENTSDYRRAHREAEYGSLEHDREFLESIAPVNHLDKLGAPLMVIHGANDPRVPLSEAEQLVDALKARGVPVEFLVFDDEGHGIVKLKNKRIMYPAIIEFLKQHL